MDPSKNGQDVTGAGQMPYQPHSYQANPQLYTGRPAIGVPSTSQHPSASHQFAFQQAQQLQYQQELQQHNLFWENQMQEIEQTTDFKSHGLPLARIKKIMKSDGDVQMISAEAPMLLAKACETFILDLTSRSWMHTQESKRRTLQKNDISAAIAKTDIFDFLCDIVPRNELKDDGSGSSKGPVPLMMKDVPCYYGHPQPPVVGPSGVVVENTTDHATFYNPQLYPPQASPMPQMPVMTWPQDQTPQHDNEEE